jgi:hypothetical protein
MTTDPATKPELDPFEPPNVSSAEESLQATRGLGYEFWIPANVSWILSLIPFLAVMVVDIFQYILIYLWAAINFVGTLMAMARGIMFKRRLDRVEKEYRHEQGTRLFIGSLFIGYIATVISLICCGIICVPITISTLNYNGVAMSGSSDQFYILLGIACLALGLWVGFLFVRMTIPKDPPE